MTESILTEEDKKRIEEEESYRVKVRKELSSEPKKIEGGKVPWWKPKGTGAKLFIFFILMGILISLIESSKYSIDNNSDVANNTSESPEVKQIWIQNTAKTYCDVHKKENLKVINIEYFNNHEESEYIDGSKLNLNACEKIVTFMNERYDKNDIENMAKGLGWIGMSPFQLIWTIGSPWDENKTIMSNYVHVQWVYGNPIYGANNYIFIKIVNINLHKIII